MSRLRVGAFCPLSLSDDPGRVSAVVFVAGCNYRCPFCHNVELVLPDRTARLSVVSLESVLARLEERKAFLDGVVISGGEPTLQPDLAPFLDTVRGMGLRTKLDTNGSRPDVLAALLDRDLLDYVAMDVKAPPARYREYAGIDVDLAAVAASIRLLRERAADYEFRTTMAPGLEAQDVQEIAEWIRGSRRYVLQPFRVPTEKGLLDPSWEAREALSAEALRCILKNLDADLPPGSVRAID